MYLVLVPSFRHRAEMWFLFSFFLFSLFFFVFLELHLRHMEVPRLEVQLELQLSAYARVTATPDLSRICDLHYGSRAMLDP